MDYKDFAARIIHLQHADLAFRKQLIQKGRLGAGYDEEMEQLHNEHARILNDIIDAIGYPVVDTVGKEASEAAWLVIQHSIGQPVFMKKCAALLQKAVSEHKADPIHLAYLADRIAVFEEKPQLYGTQFDWDENGELAPDPVDDPVKVNQRRKSIGLNTLEEQTAMIRQRAKKEKQMPPQNPDQWKRDREAWKRKAGWVK